MLRYLTRDPVRRVFFHGFIKFSLNAIAAPIYKNAEWPKI